MINWVYEIFSAFLLEGNKKMTIERCKITEEIKLEGKSFIPNLFNNCLS